MAFFDTDLREHDQSGDYLDDGDYEDCYAGSNVDSFYDSNSDSSHEDVYAFDLVTKMPPGAKDTVMMTVFLTP